MSDEPDLNLTVSGRFFSFQLLNPRREQAGAKASHLLETLKKTQKTLIYYFISVIKQLFGYVSGFKMLKIIAVHVGNADALLL